MTSYCKGSSPSSKKIVLSPQYSVEQMNFLKKILFKILSQRMYLRALHRSFYLLYDLGFLKGDIRFKYHYKIKELIQPDYTVIDIGANLGYFSKNFARLAKQGKVISIEPVPVFFETLQRFMKKFPHARVYNVALGTEEGMITMVLPETNGMIRTGLPHIAETEEEKKQQEDDQKRLDELQQQTVTEPEVTDDEPVKSETKWDELLKKGFIWFFYICIAWVILSYIYKRASKSEETVNIQIQATQ